jgi:hypothetical protein
MARTGPKVWCDRGMSRYMDLVNYGYLDLLGTYTKLACGHGGGGGATLEVKWCGYGLMTFNDGKLLT